MQVLVEHSTRALVELQSALSAGPFGVFAARPYNPAPVFLEMSILQGNFLLLVPLYGIALVTLLTRDFRDYFGYLLMALCLMALYVVIFGLSVHSFYAETGTALNRLLLQNVPVIIVTITAVLQAKAPLSGPVTADTATDHLATIEPTTNPTTTDSATKEQARERPDMGNEKLRTLLPAVVAGSGLILALAVALPLSLVMSSWGAPQSSTTATQIVSAGGLPAEGGGLQKEVMRTEGGRKKTKQDVDNEVRPCSSQSFSWKKQASLQGQQAYYHGGRKLALSYVRCCYGYAHRGNGCAYSPEGSTQVSYREDYVSGCAWSTPESHLERRGD